MNIRIIAKTQDGRYAFHVTPDISCVSSRERQQRQYICKRQYNDLSVRKYTKGEDERGRRSDGTREKGKGSGERLARAREIGVWEREKNSELNIKLHFAIGSSRRKREDPTRRNSAVTKKGNFEIKRERESYFSGIKLFAVGGIVPNITFYFRQNCSTTG